MFKAPLDLSRARILVTNDDGIASSGIAVLERVARALSKDVWTVAPETEQSAVSHSLTIRRPLRVRQIKPKVFAVDGTPTDCVMLAINHLFKDRRPTLCLSGVNRGNNVGEDVTYSGTIAAAMEATLLGVPAIALSQSYTAPHPVKWATAERHAAKVIKSVTGLGWPKNTLVNVNFPDVVAGSVKGMVAATQGRHKIGDAIVENKDPRGIPYFWIGEVRLEDPTHAGTDVAYLAEGYITITPLHLDLTHRPTLRAFGRSFPAPR